MNFFVENISILIVITLVFQIALFGLLFSRTSKSSLEMPGTQTLGNKCNGICPRSSGLPEQEKEMLFSRLKEYMQDINPKAVFEVVSQMILVPFIWDTLRQPSFAILNEFKNNSCY